MHTTVSHPCPPSKSFRFRGLVSNNIPVQIVIFHSSSLQSLLSVCGNPCLLSSKERYDSEREAGFSCMSAPELLDPVVVVVMMILACREPGVTHMIKMR
jgi:hypothetical protein